MIINLEPVFNNEGMSLPIDCSLDLSSTKYGYVNPISAPVTVHGEIKNSTGIVSIDATACFTFEAPCDRCAAVVKKQMEVPVRHCLITSLNDENDDGEYILVSDMRLDFDAVAAEDVTLNFPSKFLCSDGCKGICPQCGADLNSGTCNCKKPIDPRLEVLLQLADDENN